MHNVQYELNEQKCQDLAFFCHGRPYHASTASGVAETTHGCKTQEWQPADTCVARMRRQ